MPRELTSIEALFAQGQAAEALAELEEFLRHEPDNIRALNDLGTICLSLGRRPEAEEAFRRALKLEPEHWDASLNLALCLAAGEKWVEMGELVKKLLSVNQTEARLWALLARAEKAQGRLQAALDYLEKALGLESDRPEFQEAQARLKAQLAQPGSGHSPRLSLLMCCESGWEGPALTLCGELEKYALVKPVVANNFGPLHWAIRSASHIWLERGGQMSFEVSQHPQILDGKKVIVRLGAQEILGRQAGRIDYGLISDLVFASHFLRSVFQRKWPQVLNGRRSHVIHQAVDLERFAFIGGQGRRKIAVVGRLDYTNDPLHMLQAFKFLQQRHPELELHAAGLPDDERYYLALPDFLAKSGLEASAFFYGQVDDLAGWLADKDYILCASAVTAQGEGVLEGLHRGLRPLIYNFPGAEDLYPAEWLWSSFDELDRLLVEGPEPAACRDFVAAHYSLKRQGRNFLKVFTGEEEILETPPAQGTAQR